MHPASEPLREWMRKHDFLVTVAASADGLGEIADELDSLHATVTAIAEALGVEYTTPEALVEEVRKVVTRSVPVGYEARVCKPGCSECDPLPAEAFLSPLGVAHPWRSERPGLSGRSTTGDAHSWFGNCREVFEAIAAAEAAREKDPEGQKP